MRQVNMKLTEHLTLSSAATLSHSSELDGLRLTPHFTLAEMCKTSVNLKNVPNDKHNDCHKVPHSKPCGNRFLVFS